MGCVFGRERLISIIILFILHFTSQPGSIAGQIQVIRGIPSEVDFSRPLREWDGFGFNYVETAHTYDYEVHPQDYGGFSLLDERAKQQIIDLIFGEEGLKVVLLKMFLDPLHQAEPDGPFDHDLSTRNMLDFAGRGLEKTRERGADLTIITTL